VVKSWSSQWGLAANDLAIQVHGGYGYTRECTVEQFYRDNRLNRIHEGTFGIQALDLLGRKTCAKGGGAMRVLSARLGVTVDAAKRIESLKRHTTTLESAWLQLWTATTGRADIIDQRIKALRIDVQRYHLCTLRGEEQRARFTYARRNARRNARHNDTLAFQSHVRFLDM
jgi:hypothetical protein